MRAALVVVLAACGRIGFDGVALGDAGDDGGSGDAGDADVADAITLVKADPPVADARFGHAVALSADGMRLAVGAYGETAFAGAVYVFTWSGTAWMQEAALRASNAGANDVFGIALALNADGTVLVVGAPDEDSAGMPGDNSAPEAGAVYVFRRGVTWTEEAYLKDAGPEAMDHFGESVSIDDAGTAIAVGAWGASGQGLVSLFRQPGWASDGVIGAASGDAGDLFGIDVALSGDGNTVVIAATNEASAATGIDGNELDDSLVQAGAVYVFRRTIGWTRDAYIKASNSDAGDFFGFSVAVSSDGTRMVASSEGEDGSARGIGGPQLEGAGQSGAAYIFDRAPGWMQTTYIKASNAEADDRFGRCVAISGDGTTILVGATLEDGSATGAGGADDNARADSGAGYLFLRDGSAWTGPLYTKAVAGAAGDQLGQGCALDATGTVAALGAPFDDGGATDSGAVYVVRRLPD